MAAPDAILKLIELFNRNRDAYLSGAYKEAQLRHEFIDPFFKALGWDVYNESGYAEAYKDVIYEDAIKVGGFTKAPDYCFRIGGTRKFFVEAKKPSIDIKGEPSPAFQLRRYAWSAKLPLSILTDFEEFAVYDCRVKPVKTDKAGTARILYMTDTDYEEQWDQIASVFSREAVLQGSFDKYAEETRGKKGTAEVDDAFLKEIESWRDLIARNIALRNPALTQRELNFAVQQTIDRIIFLRICEDRGIEEYGRLMALLNGDHVYGRLFELFQRADERYNSGLFHFRKEKGRNEPADELTPALAVDDKPLKEIVKNLYYPDSAYEFSVLPADILGHVYEQFLGKVIRLTPGHRAVVDDKPEVKKAGGVYYTPTYIVDYIVKNTVGKLLEEKTPKQAAKLRILDPACGSGSFLIGAYQYLLDWHRDWYFEDSPKKHTKELYQGAGGDWRLTTAERKRILLNNIYGVDIDPQAVEVTKLSLLLKVLEGESEETLSKQLQLFHERALPDLSDNIKCGNSLISPDYFDGKQLSLVDLDERYRVNPFDWDTEFKKIMEGGGFDALIGNPPYIRIQTLREWSSEEVDYYKERYRVAVKGNYDINIIFLERGLNLLKGTGLLGFILPHKFFTAKYGESLRALLSAGQHVAEIVYFGDNQVFAGATTYTCLLFLSKGGATDFYLFRVSDIDSWKSQGTADKEVVESDILTKDKWNFSVRRSSGIISKLEKAPLRLGSVASRIAQGIRTSANEVYVLDILADKGPCHQVHSKHNGEDFEVEKSITSLFLQGRSIRPYHLKESERIVIIPYQVRAAGHAELISEDILKRQYPKAYEYLVSCKDYLESREKGRMKGPQWYGYVYPKNIEVMSSQKILVPDIASRASFALDEHGQYAFTSGYGIVLRDFAEEDRKYTLGLLNSSVSDFYLKSVSTMIRGGFFRYFTQYLEGLPMCHVSSTSGSEKKKRDKVIELVDQIVALFQDVGSAKTPDVKTRVNRQISIVDRQINSLVYELYGLTDEEIKIVEEATF
jgi:type I restriction-modification system DNA methylase subunit